MGLFDDHGKSKQDKQDEKFMKQALKEAEKAAKINEVPIGCVIVRDGKVIGRAITSAIRIKLCCHMQN